MEDRPDVRRRDVARSREAILDAAERLFAEQGPEGASLQAIGAAAGVSRGLPNYLFGSKEQLYRAVLERILNAERASVTVAAATEGGEESSSEARITAAIRAHLEFLRARPAFLKLLEREALRGGTELQTTAAYPAVLAAGRAILEREQARGGIEVADPARLLTAILALCWFPFSHAATLGPGLGIDPSRPDFCERHAAFVVRLLFDGIRPQPGGVAG